MIGKTAIVGNGDGIKVFKAAGVDAFSVADEKKARDTIRKLAKTHQIIFVTEDLAKNLRDFLKRFDEEAYPVVLSIPNDKGSEGYGMDILKTAMERALGVDILFNN